MGDVIVEVTDENFEDETVAGSSLVLVYFVSEWSPESARILSAVEEAGRKHADRVRIRTVDIDRNAETAVKYEVLVAPSIIFFSNGEEMARLSGVVTKAKLNEMLEYLLKHLPPPKTRPDPKLQPERRRSEPA